METNYSYKNCPILRAWLEADVALNQYSDIPKEIYFLAFYLKPPKGYVFPVEPEDSGIEPFDLAPFAGKTLTASKIAQSIGLDDLPATARKVGIYLRSLGFKPRKSNGMTVFDL